MSHFKQSAIAKQRSLLPKQSPKVQETAALRKLHSHTYAGTAHLSLLE
jgi:hypothetical protein